MTRSKQITLGILLTIFGFVVGAGSAGTPQERIVTKEVIKEIPRTQIVHRTPQACKKALEIDNEVFTATSTALTTFDFAPLNKVLTEKQDTRTAAYGECMGS